MTRAPRVSVGIPVRNGGKFLRETLSSLLGQSFGDFELVISDNASQDQTEDVCREMAREDSRVRYLRQPTNVGANANYNKVFEASVGELFRWAAHDDLCSPDYLERTVALIDEHEDCVLAHSATLLIDEQGRPLTPVDGQFVMADGERYTRPDPVGSERQLTDRRPSVRFRDVLLRSMWCFEIFGLMRRPALLSTGLQRNYYGADKVLLAQMALRGTIRHVEEPLWQRRCHSGTSTNLGLWEKVRWSDPGARLRVPPVARLVGGYVKAPLTTPLTPIERWGALQAVAVKAADPEKLHRLLVPGDANYWGIRGRRTKDGAAPPAPTLTTQATGAGSAREEDA